MIAVDRSARKYLIVNADDFGASTGINRGILECHTRGVVTSTSLMVAGRAAREAVSASRDHPALAVGLHFDVDGEGERDFDTDDMAAVRDEFRRQLDAFHRLLGRLPTHVDSHHHVHREEHLFPLFREMTAPLGVPLRADGGVHFVGGFYAQWEWQVTNLEYVSVPFLRRLLREEVAEGWTEISCHPGYVSPDFMSVYLAEREAEVRTLTDSRVRRAVDELGIRLASYSDYRRAGLG
jgi:predicted glycoside hydrolase/deacetylase ChbG (UPF0249 family)